MTVVHLGKRHVWFRARLPEDHRPHLGPDWRQGTDVEKRII